MVGAAGEGFNQGVGQLNQRTIEQSGVLSNACDVTDLVTGDGTNTDVLPPAIHAKTISLTRLMRAAVVGVL